MMANKYNIPIIIGLVLLSFFSCRPDDEDLTEPSFSKNPLVFTDDFQEMGSDFYFPYADSKPDIFSVDESEGYNSRASLKFDIPNASDPGGSYGGAILRAEGARNLTDYNALTFYVKASQGVTVGEFGFGEDFLENKNLVSLPNVDVGTGWQKVIIPIPTPSRLTNERGMFRYASGADANGFGYTLWIDEIQFENLGTIAHPKASIYQGEDLVEESYVGISYTVNNLAYEVNLPNGINQTMQISANYFDFVSSNEAVATVDENGKVEVVGSGMAVIQAILDGDTAEGSLTINSLGSFELAPTPTWDAASVISIFSDAYTNVPVDYYNGYFTPDGQTTQGQDDININGDNIIFYTDLNFVGIGTFLNVSPVNASFMSHLHIDINVQESIQPGDIIRIQLLNDVGGNETSGSVTLTANDLTENGWASFDIPLADFTGLADRSKLGLIFLISDATISNLFVDNIFYYNALPAEPQEAAPTPMHPAANVISLFSDAYTNVTVDSWRTSWSLANLEDVSIDGNAAKKYTNLDFVGIETVMNQVDASGMTHFHVDVWSNDLSFLGLKLVDFGSDGMFGGGDDSEHQIDNTSPTLGEWVSYDIPLSDFTGLLNTANIAQYVISGQPSGQSSVYIDNMYFHN